VLLTTAFATSGLIVVGVFLLILAGVAIGFYTYGGSDIQPHKAKSELGQPGAQGPSDASGGGDTAPERDPRERTGGGPFSTRGSR
jgi:hypothetical protein